MSKVYVGNLSWNTTTDILQQAFSNFGQVTDCIVMTDRETGKSRGFGFVTFASENEANGAINGLNDQDLDGRRIRVNLANSKPSGGGGYGGGGYGGGGGGGGYGGGGYGGQQGGYQGGGYQAGGQGGYGQQGSYADSGYGQQAAGGYGGQQGGYPQQGGYQQGGQGGGY